MEDVSEVFGGVLHLLIRVGDRHLLKDQVNVQCVAAGQGEVQS